MQMGVRGVKFPGEKLYEGLRMLLAIRGGGWGSNFQKKA